MYVHIAGWCCMGHKVYQVTISSIMKPGVKLSELEIEASYHYYS